MAKKSTPATNSKVAAESRQQAQAQIRAKERRTTVGIWVAVVAGVALFAALVWFIVGQAQAPDLADSDDAVPAGSTESGGFPLGTSGAVGGDAPEGALEVAIYLDYLCPICGQFEAVAGEDIAELREEGTIHVTYHPVSILDRLSASQYSTRAANAAATVADAAPAHFVAFQDALFANQPPEEGDHWSDAQLADFAVDAGVPPEVAETIDDGIFRRWVEAATQQASVDGMQGTPTVMVEGEIVDPDQVPYFQEGVLRGYLESRAAEQ